MPRLYERFLDAAHAALRPGGRLAVIFPSGELRERAQARFRLVESHEQRVHRSMTRHYGVFERD
jgi:tRNA G10  N-methylase Trm11